MWKIYRKIHNNINAISPFLMDRKSYSYDNVEAMWNRLNERDQQLFKFDMKNFDWTKYLVDHFHGIRFFLCNEDNSTLETNRIRFKR